MFDFTAKDRYFTIGAQRFTTWITHTSIHNSPNPLRHRREEFNDNLKEDDK